MPAGQSKTVEIEGAPVLDGRILTASGKEFDALTTLDDYARLARRVRGSFAIIVREAGAITVVTDFTSCFPVFYLNASGTFHVSSRLWELRQFSSGKISAAALFFYAAKKGIGDDPLYSDVRTVGRGKVVRFSEGKLRETTWLDWESFLEEFPWSPAAARERFLEIASGFLAPYVQSGDGVACTLSSGTDSAVCAYVLKLLDPAALCLSADYRIRRYSECALASVHAQRIGVRHRRIRVTLRDHRRALFAMNDRFSDLPARHSHLTSLYALARHARETNVRYIISAEFAGGLFMEFGGYFDRFNRPDDYLRHVAELTPPQKLKTITQLTPLSAPGEELLRAMRCSPQECRLWIESRLAADHAMFQQWICRFPFPLLHNLRTQIFPGVRFQNGWLPALRAAGGGMQFIDPFLDLEMIRFVLSLPFTLKWNPGKNKVLLRDILEEGTGIRAPKRPSPNPARIWSLLAGFRDGPRLDVRLRDLHKKRTILNLRRAGAQYEGLLETFALGMWLRAHDLGQIDDQAG